MKKIIFAIACISIAIACSKDDDEMVVDENNAVFDRQAMLVNWADNIIIPSYISFNTAVDDMQNASNTFTADASLENLNALRSTWQSAYLAFQNVSMFEIGAAESLRLRDRFNAYPTNTDEIESFIASGEYNFNLPSTNDAQGFPALDYLLYGLAETDAAILAFYTSHSGAEAYKNYLSDVVGTINDLTSETLNSWQSSFRNEFVNNDGSSASASVDKLTNDFVFYYEKSLRAGKIGIPAGVFSNQPLPENVEAFYVKDFSKKLTLEALNATVRFFEGKSFENGSNGPGFDDYLDFLNTIKNGDDLSSLIRDQFAMSHTKLMDLDSDFSNQILTNNNAMLAAYDELQRNVILLKVDMLQALSVNVDYVDADGD